MSWQSFLYVGLGGAVGAMLRYGCTLWWQRSPDKFPFAIIAINLMGSLVLGALTPLILKGNLSEGSRLLIAVGLLGAFTTFSTFSAENVLMWRDGHLRWAMINVGVSVLGGLGLAYGGMLLSKRLLG